MSQSNTSESPPAKRRRMDGAEELTRSDIWHDDGSVVLQVESTLFRVHWSVISLHSPFFRGMRDLPQPAEQPSIEGCPVVVLHDSSEDVQYFLHALYNPHLFNEEKLSFPFIAAIVRVGRKYDFKNLLAAAVQRLRLENPTTFDKYEAMTRVEGSTISFTTQLMSSQPGIILDILTLVRESNLFELLPSAYLRALLCHSQQWSPRQVVFPRPTNLHPRKTENVGGTVESWYLFRLDHFGHSFTGLYGRSWLHSDQEDHFLQRAAKSQSSCTFHIDLGDAALPCLSQPSSGGHG